MPNSSAIPQNLEVIKVTSSERILKLNNTILGSYSRFEGHCWLVSVKDKTFVCNSEAVAIAYIKQMWQIPR